MSTKQILIIIIIVAVTIAAIVYFNSTKENEVAETQKFSWVADMTGNSKEDKIPSDIDDLLRKRVPIRIEFIGKDKKETFNKVFSTEEICQTMNSKEDRRNWWRREGCKQLQQMKDEFNEWKSGRKPYRSYAVAIDVTEGWNGVFSLSNYFEESDISWMNEKEFSIDIYSIGYNEVPGRRSIKGKSIAEIEKMAKAFLSTAPKEMPETRLLEQINYIFKKPYFRVVIISDLMQNTKALSAYKYSSENVDFDSYFQEETPPKKVTFKIVKGGIAGISGKRQAWYDLFEEKIQESFSQTEFVFE